MDLSDVCQIHMVGVCGVGMAGLARMLAARGHAVSGCDCELNEFVPELERAGVEVFRGHSEEHLAALSNNCAVVMTSAVSCSEPEIIEARKKGIPVIRRGEVLASLMSMSSGVAVCGTHGKTTTACFTARLFQELGADPGWCIGGFTPALGSVAAPGDNDLLIVEADESDATLRYYHPAVTVVNNIDIDHLEHFEGEDDLLECFRDVVRQTRNAVCVCSDDARALRVVRECGISALNYGFSDAAVLRAGKVAVAEGRCSFDLFYKGCFIDRVSIAVGGRHNLLNALGAAASAIASGYSVEQIAQVLPTACAELPMRRFEELGINNDVRYIADYAHHPAELKAAVQMALDCSPRRLVAVFQPHRYTRTLAMGREFPAAFEGVDEVILLPVYAASESPLEGGDICDLYAFFREQADTSVLTLSASLAECCSYLTQTVHSGDLVLIAGAGDVIRLRSLLTENVRSADTEALVDKLNGYPGVRASLNRNLQPCSIFPTRGRGMFAEADDKESVAAAVSLCRRYGVDFRPAGAGFNTLISDCGSDACLISLVSHEKTDLSLCYVSDTQSPSGTESVGVEYSDECLIIRVSCSENGAELLEELKVSGLSGLEFMTGIPGTVGGWLAMNAGAHGACISDSVESVEFVDQSGRIMELPAGKCGFSYRSCVVLENGFALSCRLCLKQSSPESVNFRMAELRKKRIPLSGFRTAGSVFKNPRGDSAGRLLDEAGCRGLRVGGAYVADFHANIIVADNNCSASDVIALVKMMRNRVGFRYGVELCCEIKGFTL
ncbi:MAG: UDP-N-acetylmuramate--L-alanine ligase [Kiritimatiellia bacterium]